MKKNKLLIFTVALAFTLSVIYACKTPVYKYAILNWTEREIYHVFRVYDSTKGHEELPEEIKTITSNNEFYGNYGVIPVDLSTDLKSSFGEGFKEFITEQVKGKKLPTYSIVSPVQNTIYTGDITTEEFKNLGTSPKTLEIAKKLSEGEIVFLFFPPKDKEAQDEKRKMVDSALKKFIEIEKRAQLESGDLPPETKPEDVKAVKASFVEISKDDPKEKFLYAMLKGVNQEFKDDDSEKLMGVVGRGFVFETILTGETFNEDEIIGYGIFLSGPCSCTVKSGNPGTDIITNWDWDAKIKVEPDPENDEEAPTLAGFGGNEIESVDEPAKEDMTEKDKNEIKEPITAKPPVQTIVKSETGEQIADEKELSKIILFSIIGLGVVLLVITKLMKNSSQK